MSEPTQPLLSVEHLTVDFRSAEGKTVRAIEDVSFSVQQEQTLALVGESGSGKSVSSLAIMGLLPRRTAKIDPNSRVYFKGQSLLDASEAQLRSLRGQRISMIFQDPMSSLNPVYSVGAQLSEMLRVHKGLSKSAATARALALLEEVGIPEPQRRLRSYPHELSGGQQQRVMIAMALSTEPDLLIADEPTTALDVTIQRQILELLVRLQHSRRMSMLFISHDLALVGEFAHAVVVMRAGHVKEAGLVNDLFSSPHDPYTKALLACRPDPTRPGQRLQTIDDFLGAPSSPAQPLAPTAERPSAPILEGPLLEVKGLRKVFERRKGLFGTDPFVAVDSVSFQLNRGQTVGIVGESGSGKTTTGLCLLRLHRATAGTAIFEGRDLLSLSDQAFAPYKRRVQIIFQNPYASLNPRFTVGQILEEPMMLHGIGSAGDDRQARAVALLERVGLGASAMNRYPHEFSGGQRQRIAIARCLTLSPDLIVCDEAVSALDVSVQAQVLNLLKELQDDLGLSYLFISHDLGVVRHMSDLVIVMQNGRVVEQGPAAMLYEQPAHPYTRELLAAAPRGRRLSG
ncbi:MAG: Glutathione import ATP-binding protein GsiA [Pseudomonadota bacterium]